MDKLDMILGRGKLRVGVRDEEHSFIKWPKGVGIGEPEGFEPTLARCLAVALFNDPKAIEWIPVNGNTRFTYVKDDTVDIAFRSATYTLTRDAIYSGGAQSDVDFGPVYYYDFNQIFLRSDYVGQNPLMDSSVKIAVTTTAQGALTNWRNANGYAFTIIGVATNQDLQDAYNNGSADGVSGDGSLLKGLTLSRPYKILPEYTTEEPLAPVVKKEEGRWADVVRWVYFALLQAEESGGVDRNLFGRAQAANLGLNPFWARNVINRFGDYGAIFAATLPLTFYQISYVPPNNNSAKPPKKLNVIRSRGINEIWTKGGQHYPPPGL